MNIDHILESFNNAGVDFILIGGVNFLLNHEPVLTFDVDVWVSDTFENLNRVNQALQALGAEWGETAETFRAVSPNPSWLEKQMLFCLFTPFGDLDIFRGVRGLEGRYEECKMAAAVRQTPAGVRYFSLSDRHMIACQLALDEPDRKLDRIKVLRQAAGNGYE